MPRLESAIFLIGRSTALQFLALTGAWLGFGLVFTLVSRWTNNLFRQFLFPRLGIYVFGWIGVPVHELSHAFFCWVFGHQVTKIKWFDPHASGGTYGEVVHTYNPRNPYQQVGRFFIGLGPVILGPLLILLIFMYLGHGWVPYHGILRGALRGIHPWRLVCSLLTGGSGIGVLYLATCISSQMELSKKDLEGVLRGCLAVLALLLLANTAAYLLHFPWERMVWHAASEIGDYWSEVSVLALALAALNLAICYLLFTGIHLIARQPLPNPFRGGAPGPG